MSLQHIGQAGSILVDDLRSDLSTEALPTAPHFVVRANQAGPLALTSLSLGFSLLLPAAIQSTNGWLVYKFPAPPQAGQSLGWTVFAGFSVPELGAFMVVNKKVKALGRKKRLPAGKTWAASKVLTAYHLS